MKDTIFLGCASLLLLATPAMAGVKEGVDAWVAKDYPRAIAEWKLPAAAGDPDAQFNMAQAYKLGRGVPANPQLAMAWYRKAASSGHEQAQATLGLTLFQDGQREEALQWLQKAADRGEPRAQYVVATALFNGDSLPRDWPRAYALMTRAASAGINAAINSLTQMDGVIPEAQKSAGIALAREMDRTEKLMQAEGRTGPASGTKATDAAKVASAATPPKAAPVAVKPPAAVKPPVPVTKPSSAPAPASAAAGWRLQLGAFSSAKAAEAGWGRIAAATPSIKKYAPHYASVGAVTRLQITGFVNRPAADQTCLAIKSAGNDCFIVAP